MLDTPLRGAVPELALQAIQRLIDEGEYQPGDALPAQRELAQNLGVSRASLREALSSLSAMGVVSVQPGKGVFVKAQKAEQPASASGFAWPFAAQVSAADTFQLRYVLEGFAAGQAANGLTTEALDALAENVEAMGIELKARNFEAAARLDFAFHRGILEASGNLAMLQIVMASEAIYIESQKLPFIRPERAMETWKEHKKILNALARHSAPAAQKAMQEHIRSAALRTGIVFSA
ncbi:MULTISPECIES: FadR/GntR family transcriptional regulator [Pseudomonas]|uniref:FadR family transcriptional regulator n=1 Tax=Pseudomonas entomophila TaxID=312306 RepID=A0A3Q8U0I3_9PSED|nr:MULTISPECIES: FadR/GntR family transcriptional regulator [Pseudomonas]AZL68323.1 FadR family transcriptional regulator [Pseudomonas oryziphila]MDZ4017006.1 HTH-type transcriptional regulator LutR [Pseudomonas sichuanensis]UVL91440.1 FadR family transcriptional regulator [Pseudomonas sichuanensis]